MIMKKTRNEGLYALMSFKYAYISNISYFVIGLIFLIIASLTTVQAPKIAGKLLDVISIGREQLVLKQHALVSLGTQMVIVVLVSAFCNTMNQYFIYQFSEKSINQIKKKLSAILLRKELAFYDSHQAGELFSIINVDTGTLRTAFSSNLATLIYKPIIATFCVVNMIIINIHLTLVLIIILPIVLFITSRLMKKLKTFSKQLLECYAISNSALQESLSLIRTIKTFTQEAYQDRKYNRLADASLYQAIKTKRMGLLMEIIVIIISVIFVSFILYVAVRFILKGELTTGEFTAFFIYAIMAINSLSATVSSLGNMQHSYGAAERINDIINSDTEYVVCQNNNSVGSISFISSIEFTNVEFFYPTRSSVMIYKNLNIVISKGSKIGIIGASGSGKTSLVNMLLRLYPSTSGNILIDGIDIYNLDLYAYRSLFAYVPQEVRLFSGTIKENLNYENKHITETELVDACIKSQCHEFIISLPNGYDTIIGDNGITLSGGQRQRIAIARAILRNAQIFILDEITSAIDTETEKIITARMLECLSDKTIIVLSHKHELISKMDSVYKVENKNLCKIR